MESLTASARRGRSSSILGKILAYAVMGLFALITVYPLLWLFLSSFKTTNEFQVNMLGLPISWTIDNYIGAWKIGEFDKLIGNSVLYTFVSTFGIILFSLQGGFAFAKIKSKATAPLYGSFIIGILLTIQSLMVPLFLQVTALDRILGDFFRTIGLFSGGNSGSSTIPVSVSFSSISALHSRQASTLQLTTSRASRPPWWRLRRWTGPATSVYSGPS